MSWALQAADVTDLIDSKGSTEHVIVIESLQFSPSTIEINVGDTVTWINRDFVPHTATALDGSWDSGSLELDEQFSLVVDADTFKQYFCVFHPSMKASLE